MLKMRMADLTVAVDNKYPYFARMAKDYLCDSEAQADLTVSVTEEEILAENTEGGYHPAYLETLAVYRKIATEIAGRRRMLAHGVLMEADGHGILLCARSGVGKSTHSRLWTETLGSRCHIVNGDKPLFRVTEDEIFGYGTPWCGKEGISENRRVGLHAVAFISRSETNETRRLTSKAEILQRMMPQIFFPENGAGKQNVLAMLGIWLDRLPFFEIRCNMEREAAQVASSVILPVLETTTGNGTGKENAWQA